jgi:hypothetical protein
MPRAAQTFIQKKKRGRPPLLDAEGGRINPPRIRKPTQKQKQRQLPERYINSVVRHYYDTVYNNVTYTQQEETIKKPENIQQHWTNNPNHFNWLRYWNLHQQITLLENKFFETVDWSLFDIINNYQKVKYELLVNGRILHYEERETLETRYATNQPHQIRNQVPQIQNTFYSNILPSNSIIIYPPPSSVTSDSSYIQNLKGEATPSPSCY